MKKITPVFGPQELFNGAANCDEYLVAVQHLVGQKTKVSFYPSLVEAFNYVVDFPPRGVVFHRAAMRKIEEVPDSQLVTDGMPSFYVGSSGACTHKMAESDIPVWCNDVDDTCTAMGFINDCLRLTRKPNRWTIADQKAGRLPDVGCMVMVTSVDECASVAAINNDAVCVVFHDGEFTTLHKSGISPLETPEEKAERLEDEFVNELMKDGQVIYTSSEQLAMCRKTARAAYRKLSGALSVPTKGGE